MNESCHTWMSHITRAHVTHSGKFSNAMAVHESCHIRMSSAAYKWVASQINKTCHIWMSHVTYEWGVSRMYACRAWRAAAKKKIRIQRLWMGQFTYNSVVSHMDESLHVCTCVRRVTQWQILKRNGSAGNLESNLVTGRSFSKVYSLPNVLHKTAVELTFEKNYQPVLLPGVSVSPRAYPTLLFDDESNNLIIFGIVTCIYMYKYRYDLHIYDLSSLWKHTIRFESNHLIIPGITHVYTYINMAYTYNAYTYKCDIVTLCVMPCDIFIHVYI